MDELTSLNGGSPVPSLSRDPPVLLENPTVLHALSGFDPLTVSVYQGWSLDTQFTDNMHRDASFPLSLEVRMFLQKKLG